MLGLSLVVVGGASTLVAVLGLLVVAVLGLLVVGAFCAVEHRLCSAGSVDMAHGLSCPVARGVLVSDQGSNTGPCFGRRILNPRHQGSPHDN